MSIHENNSYGQNSQENSPHDIIKEILQKIIDEMGTLESDRIMPEHRKPKVMALEVEAAVPVSDELDVEDDELDPTVLNELLTKADDADETGAFPEDAEDDLPPEIGMAVRRKKKLKKEVQNPDIFS